MISSRTIRFEPILIGGIEWFIDASPQLSRQKNMELEDEEKRREKRQQMAANAQAKQAARADPLAPAAVQSTGAMDALLDKLRAAGPSSREKRDARRRARLRQNGAIRAASITKEADTGGELSGTEGGDDQQQERPSSSAAAASQAVTSDAEQRLMSPDITVTSAAEDNLSKRTEEMLMLLRGDGGGESSAGSALSKGSMRDKRKERRRRNGSNVSTTSTGSGPASLLLASSPPIPPLPTNLPSSPGLTAPGGAPDIDDPVARAKSALLAMRRGSETGSINSTASEVTTTQEPDPSSPNAVVDEGSDHGPPSPTTIVSPPSPDPSSQS